MKQKEFEQYQKWIANYIHDKCLYLPKDLMYGKLIGTRYSGQYYISNGLYNVEFMQRVVKCFKYIIDKEIGHYDFQITGMSWTACPLIITIPMLMKEWYDIDINCFLIKDKRKLYGRRNFIEGYYNDKPVLIVDGVCNSINSFAFCKYACECEELTVMDELFAVHNKYRKTQVGKSFEFERSSGQRCLSIVTGDDIHDIN